MAGNKHAMKPFGAERSRHAVVSRHACIAASGRITFHEAKHQAPSLLVGKLARRRFHVIAGWTNNSAAHPAIQRNLGAPDGIDNDARRIWRIPDFELQFKIERGAAETGRFEPDVRDLAVL